MEIELVCTMLAVGLLLGFIGAGGSGFIIAVLTLFGYSIHTALGTALLTMILSSVSGAVSHYREGNIRLRTGVAVGIAGALAAWAGSFLSDRIPGGDLKWLTAAMLFVSGLVLWLRIGIVARRRGASAEEPSPSPSAPASEPRFGVKAATVGLFAGTLSGMFGIGSTPFIQIGLMQALGMPVRLAAGTTMLVIIPIAVSGGFGFYRLGHVDVPLLMRVAASVMVGSYIGAKFTGRAPARWLQTAMVLVPMIGGALLLLQE